MVTELRVFTTASEEQRRELLLSLVEAESEAQVHAVLGAFDLLQNELWVPYGGVPNNSGAFLNQQSSARGALVEKVVNSVDAVLTAEAHRAGDFETSNLPATMFEASERYLGIHEGRLAEITPTERTEIAERSVQIVFSGARSPGYPTVTIADQGEGQRPNDFASTFMSLQQGNKMKIPFVQGKFNMGSTGAVPFCGEKHCYQLVVSRRDPMLPGGGGGWGFTVVRRHWPEGDERASQFQYLSPEGSILSVADPELPLWTSAEGGLEAMDHGSVIRMYEYQIPERTAATLDFARMLNRRLYRIPIPLQIVETRNYRAHSPATTAPGLETRLIEDEADVVEPGFPVGDDVQVRGVGWIRVSIVPFRKEANTGRWLAASESVVFTVNGQAHAFESRDFFRRGGRQGVELRYLATDLLVEVDCTRLPPSTIEQLFMGSRDRMRDNKERSALLGELASHLSSHVGLRKLNHRRRLEAIERTAASSEETHELFSEMLASDPELAALFGSGGRLPSPARAAETNGASFEGKRFPTFLRWPGNAQVMDKSCPEDGYCRLELETDAANDFFSRPEQYGTWDVQPASWVRGVSLWEGLMTVTVGPPEGVSRGVEQPIKVSVDSPGSVFPLVAEAQITVKPPGRKGRSPTGPRSPKKSGVAEPDIREVDRSEWATQGFDETSVATVDVDGDSTIVWVNMSNDRVESFLYRHPARANELRQAYKLLSAVFALALENGVLDESLNRDAAEAALKHVGKVVLPAIDFAGALRTGTDG